ncbi:MAG: DUF4258 domain-containing protein [bacterium]
MGEPLKPEEAKDQIRRLLSEGRIVYSIPHARQRLQERNISNQDCENVLRGGKVEKAHREGSKWRHKVTTSRMEVVVQFLPYDRLLIVTAWRTGRQR